MLRPIVVKELIEGIFGYRFMLSFILALAVIPASVYLGVERYKTEAEQYVEASRQALEEVQTQSPKPPHAAAHVGISIWKPPTPLMALSVGAQDVLGVRTRIDPHVTPQLTGGTSERTPLLTLFGKFDYASVIQVIFGLFAFVLSFDLIAGEREDGTLKLVLANRLARSVLLLGKTIGGSLILILPVALATLVGLLFLTPLWGVSLSGDQWLQVAGVIALSFLFLIMMFLGGLLVSSLARTRIASIIALLFVWVILIFIIPRTATSMAQKIQPIPSAEEVAQRLQEVRNEEHEKSQERVEAWLGEHPGSTPKDMPQEVVVANRRLMDEGVEKQESLIQQSVDAALARQVELATNLARVSPATSYLLSVTRLTGTGVDRHSRFLRYLNEYRHRFRDFFDQIESTGATVMDDFADVPQFTYQEERTTRMIASALVDGGIMVFVSLVLFAASYWAFIRYDVR